jgi:hypothetical protein
MHRHRIRAIKEGITMSATRTYYHGTRKKNVPSILKRGLIPKKPKWVSEFEPKGIFMWGSLESAMHHVADGEVIFEVHVPVDCQVHKRRNDGESLVGKGYEFIVLERIAPDNLRIVHEEPEIPGDC